RLLALLEGTGESRHLVELLNRERHPAQDLVVEARLVALVDRRVLERARSRDHDVGAGPLPQLPQQREAAAEVVDPDVATGYDTREEGLVRGPAVPRDQLPVLVAAHEVEADRRHG